MAACVSIKKKKKDQDNFAWIRLDDSNPAFNIFWESATLLLVTKMFVLLLVNAKNKQWWCQVWNLFAWDAVEYAVENKFFE